MLRSHPTLVSPLDFYFCALYFSFAILPLGTLRVEKTSVCELAHLSHVPDRATAGRKSAGLPEVTWCNRAQMGPFPTSVADGQLRLGVTDGSVNLLRQLISNGKISHFLIFLV